MAVLLCSKGGQPPDHFLQGGDAARIDLPSMIGFELHNNRRFDYRYAAVIEVWEERIIWRLSLRFQIQFSVSKVIRKLNQLSLNEPVPVILYLIVLLDT